MYHYNEYSIMVSIDAGNVTSPELRVLNSCAEQLTTGLSLCLLQVATKLLQENLVSDTVMEEMLIPTLTAKEKSMKLMLCIRRQIELSQHNFSTFIRVIQEEPILNNLADVLNEKYRKLLLLAN